MDDYPKAFSKEDTTGTQSVRDAAEFMYEMGFPSEAIFFAHNGRRYLVELRVLCSAPDCDPMPKEFSEAFKDACARHAKEVTSPWVKPRKL